MTQFARPDADISSGGWTSTPLWSKIDEAVSDDTDRIQSGTGGQTFECGLTDVTDPQNSANHKFTVRRRSQAGGTLTLALVQGTTIIKSQADTTPPTAFGDITVTLSAAEADTITDYSDLRLRITNDLTFTTSVSQMWFECDDAPSGGVATVVKDPIGNGIVPGPR